ncbi:hypothetical protein HMSSN036_47160 [Paenibacillus macerans]|nr:hypothetical protein HMSSN036_47160 [Paenibacillus macerans]
MTTQTVLPVEAEQLKKISAKRGEPAWLTENRSRALQLAAELELPKLEKTRLDRWDLNNYGGLSEVRQEKTQQLPESITSLVDLTEQSNLLVQRNSDTVFTRLAPELAAKGVIFTDLETAAREHGDLVQKYLHAAVKPEETSLPRCMRLCGTAGYSCTCRKTWKSRRRCKAFSCWMRPKLFLRRMC